MTARPVSDTRRAIRLVAVLGIASSVASTAGCASSLCCRCPEIENGVPPAPAAAPAPMPTPVPEPRKSDEPIRSPDAPAPPPARPPTEAPSPVAPSARDAAIDLGDGSRLRLDGEDVGRLAGASTAELDVTLGALRDRLRVRAAAAPREPGGASTVQVFVRGERTAKWKYVQWIMQVCADPAVQIYKIHIAVTRDASAR